MISTLKTDPNLPARLRDDVEEMNAYWFYKQNVYDSVAPHLEKALTNATTDETKPVGSFYWPSCMKCPAIMIKPLRIIRQQLKTPTIL